MVVVTQCPVCNKFTSFSHDEDDRIKSLKEIHTVFCPKCGAHFGYIPKLEVGSYFLLESTKVDPKKGEWK